MSSESSKLFLYYAYLDEQNIQNLKFVSNRNFTDTEKKGFFFCFCCCNCMYVVPAPNAVFLSIKMTITCTFYF